MTRILLASASILAFAGAAAAQDDNPTGIIFGGDASLGFNDATINDLEGDEDDNGFFYEANLSVTLRTILDNGLVAESTFTIPVADTNIGDTLTVDNDFVLGLSIDGVGALQIGDVTFGAEEFSFANMQSADFSEQDSEVVLRGEGTIAGFTIAASTIIQDPEGDQPGERAEIIGFDPGPDGLPGTADDIGILGADPQDDYVDQISIGGNGNLGLLALSFGYQEESDIIDGAVGEDSEGFYNNADNGDFNAAEQFGIAAGLAFRGADIKLGYGRNLSGAVVGFEDDGTQDFSGDATESYGVQVSYPIGPVTVGAEYVFEPDAEEYGSDTEYSYNLTAAYETDRVIVEAEFGEEIGEEEYDIKVGYAFSDVTQVQLGYNDDDGGFIALRQGIGSGAFVEASYAEVDDAGFGNDNFTDDVRIGATLKVGLEF